MRENGCERREQNMNNEHHKMVTKCGFIEYMLDDFYGRVKNKHEKTKSKNNSLTRIMKKKVLRQRPK